HTPSAKTEFGGFARIWTLKPEQIGSCLALILISAMVMVFGSIRRAPTLINVSKCSLIFGNGIPNISNMASCIAATRKLRAATSAHPRMVYIGARLHLQVPVGITPTSSTIRSARLGFTLFGRLTIAVVPEV